MNKQTRVGFIGLGLMGNPMAKNLKKAGFDLKVYNRSKEKLEEFIEMGVPVYNSPAELAKDCDVVISIVTGPEDVREVMVGPEGVIVSGNSTLTAIDMSTIGPSAATEVGEVLAEAGIEFLDAPVTGSVAKATTGELTIFIGGKEDVFENAKPIFKAMGTNLQYMGKSGSGQAIKLINNLIVASTITTLAEGFLLADMMQLPREKVAQALEDVPALSFFMKLKLPNMVNNDFPVAFSMANMDKDLRLALSEMQNADGNLEVLKKVEQYYSEGLEKGLGSKDISAVLKVLQEKG
ncbi:MAG: NAD(P)-dependent oxidoreductase [Patescibacteria group bacterium]